MRVRGKGSRRRGGSRRWRRRRGGGRGGAGGGPRGHLRGAPAGAGGRRRRRTRPRGGGGLRREPKQEKGGRRAFLCMPSRHLLFFGASERGRDFWRGFPRPPPLRPQVAGLAAEVVGAAERFGLRLPREFGLLVKQALYFDRCNAEARRRNSSPSGPHLGVGRSLAPPLLPLRAQRYLRVLAPGLNPLTDPRIGAFGSQQLLLNAEAEGG